MLKYNAIEKNMKAHYLILISVKIIIEKMINNISMNDKF
jgi:hypothetical protein